MDVLMGTNVTQFFKIWEKEKLPTWATSLHSKVGKKEKICMIGGLNTTL